MAFLRKLFHRLYSKGIFYWNHALQKSRVSRTYLMEWGLKLKAWCWTLVSSSSRIVLNNFIIKQGWLSPGWLVTRKLIYSSSCSTKTISELIWPARIFWGSRPMISSFWWFLFWWGTKKPWKNRLWRWLCQSLLRGENEAIRWVRRNPGGGDCVDTKRRRGKSTSLWRYCGPSLMQIPPLDQVGKKIFPSFKFCSDRTHSSNRSFNFLRTIVTSYPTFKITASAEDKTSSKFQTWNISSKSLVKTDALEFLNIGKWLLLLFSLKVYFLRLLTASP